MKNKNKSIKDQSAVTVRLPGSSHKEMRRERDAWDATQHYQQQIYATPAGRLSNALREEGHRLKARGAFERAHEKFVLAASQHAVSDESAAAAACWYDLGQSFTEIRIGIRKQNLMEAVRLLRRAELATVRRADVRRHILSLDGLGRALREVAAEFHSGEALAEALQRLRKAVKLARDYGLATLDLLMNSLVNLGNALLQAGEVDEAIRVHEESLLLGEIVERDMPSVEHRMSEGLVLSLRRLNLVRALYSRGQITDLSRAQQIVELIVMSESPLHVIAPAYLIGYEIARHLNVPRSELVSKYLKHVEITQLESQDQRRFILALRDEGERERAIFLARLCASNAIQERHDARADVDADHCAAKAQGFSRLAAEMFASAYNPIAAFVALENTAAMRYFDAVTRCAWSSETPLLRALDMLHGEASGWSSILDDLAWRVAGFDPSIDAERLHELFDVYSEHLRAQPKALDFEWEGSGARIQEVFSRAKHNNMPGEVLREHSRRLSNVTISLKEAIERLDPSQFKVSEQDWSNEVAEEMVRRVLNEQPGVVLLRLSMSADNLLAVSVWKEHGELRGVSKTFEFEAVSVSALFMLARLETPETEDQERAQSAMNAFLASIDLSAVLPDAPQRLIVLPSQVASYVPWAACGPPGRMLIELADEVSYLPNITPLLMRQAPCAPRSGALIVAPGAACKPATIFHGLAFSETANEETRLVEAAATRLATDEHVSSADVVSFFAHGSYNEQNPLGVIQLADGLFIPREYSNSWRGVERVEIWACRTGVNISYDPLTPWVDEAFGLDIDLHHLGVRSTIGTFWNVPDLVTALLVREYRRALARGRRAPAALADAQRWWRAEGCAQVRSKLESGDLLRDLSEQAASLGIDATLVDELIVGALGPVPKDNKLSAEEVDRLIRLWSSPIAWAGFRFLGVCERRPLRELAPPETLTSTDRVLIAEILKRP
jgi:hypothetical protein